MKYTQISNEYKSHVEKFKQSTLVTELIEKGKLTKPDINKFCDITSFTLNTIVNYFNEENKFNLKIEDLYLETRKQPISLVRQICQYQIIKEIESMDVKFMKKRKKDLVGKFFNRDRTSVINSLKVIRDYLYFADKRLNVEKSLMENKLNCSHKSVEEVEEKQKLEIVKEALGLFK